MPTSGALVEIVQDKEEVGCWICGQNWSDRRTLPMICADCEKDCGKKGSCDPLEDFALMHYLWKHVHVSGISEITKERVE